MASSRMLESMDRSVSPCQDFYTFACGSWKKKHVIPEDRSSLNVFGVLRDNVQIINKSKLHWFTDGMHLINPYLPSGRFHPYQLDEFISLGVPGVHLHFCFYRAR